MKRILSLSLALLSLTTIWSQTAPAKKKIGVYVTGKGTEVAANKTLSAMLTDAIISQKEYMAVDITEQFVTQIQKEKKSPKSSAVDDNQISRLGKQFGVEFVYVASIYKYNDTNFLFLNLVDVEKASVVASTAAWTPFTDPNQTKSIANDLAKEIPINLSQKEENEVSFVNVPSKYDGGIDFVLVEGGNFMMGATPEQKGSQNDEKPAHQVTLSSFKISKTEVTVSQFAKFIEATGYYIVRNSGDERDSWKYWCSGNDPKQCNMPVVNISYHDAVEYCNWVGGRLPTEAEWEYAARGGNKSQKYLYAGGNKMNEIGWYNKNWSNRAHPVATLKPNELGIYDMSGNVSEMCLDWYSENYYSQSASENPMGPNTGTRCVIRGGGSVDEDKLCRSAFRKSAPKSQYTILRGFRVVQQ